MVDYGHDLKFGTFITPTAARPDEVVRLARVADRAGFDLVSFQDHPYQPALLDAWSLLAFVAARTERAHLMVNVTNLPLRLPVVIARASVTIDLLSGGRFELGLGTGSFWDAIEAVGGRRLSPGQSVTALEEAVRVIRELWSSEPGGARVDGEFYKLAGAKRGPRAAHSIGISLGAYGPRMLQLTGRVADGWVPSYDYLARETDLADMNRRIDDGAESAGRAPVEIRRWLNIGGVLTADGEPGETATGWAERLAQLALDYGMSGFNFASDDARALERFAAEVIPKTHALVAAGRL